VVIHPPKAPRIIEVIWSPPLQGWCKCNTNGNSKGNPRQPACSGILRNFNSVIGCFAQYLGIATALVAEIMGVILAMECASNKH
jgi:ribonuclease HI